MGPDSFYTPTWLSHEVAAAIASDGVEAILDPAVGEGRLLLPLGRGRWSLFGLDNDTAVVEQVGEEHPDWIVGVCDWLNDLERVENSVVARWVAAGADGIVLNPPFTCRGGTVVEAASAPSGERVRCSVAMAFLLGAASMVRVGGRVVALMPAGSMASQKDHKAWSVLRRLNEVEVLGRFGIYTFTGVHASTALVRLTKRSDAIDEAIEQPHSVSRRVLRGWVQMHAIDRSMGPWRPLIHTTVLADGLGKVLMARATRTILGTWLLFPRVGRPKPEHVSVYRFDEPTALSDCILGVECESSRDASELRRAIVDRWEDFRRLYDGSCAPYVTVASMDRWIHEVVVELGLDESVVRRPG